MDFCGHGHSFLLHMAWVVCGRNVWALWAWGDAGIRHGAPDFVFLLKFFRLSPCPGERHFTTFGWTYIFFYRTYEHLTRWNFYMGASSIDL